MTAYYNEHDPFAAAWLRELIADGQIAAGHVDERDIRDVPPSDLDGYTQCHFFAGIGGWSYALRLAGWPDDRPVWTGSAPCQPFSAAGRGGGFADERHLWPAFFHLIGECRPATVFGEQVASKDGLGWLDLVHADLEGAGYAVGAADLCAAGVGAPHIRQRLWWMADADQQRHDGRRARGARRDELAHDCNDGVLADSLGPRLEGRDARALGHECEAAERGGEAGELGDAGREGRRQVGEDAGGRGGGSRPQGVAERPCDELACGPWSDLKWLSCRDGKARPTWATQRGFKSMADGLWPSMVGSSATHLSPLATGQANRVSMLRGAGNAIVPQVAAEFIKAAMS